MVLLHAGCLISCWSSLSNSPGSCGSPELHRDPGHLAQGQLERTRREERRSHRYHVWLSGNITGRLVHCWEIKTKPSLDEAWMFCKLGFNQFAEQQGRLSSGRLTYWYLNAARQSSPRSRTRDSRTIQLRAEQKPSGDVTVISPVFVKVDVLAPPSRVFFFSQITRQKLLLL